MTDRLSIFGGRGGVQTVKIEGRKNLDQLFELVDHTREEVIISRAALEYIAGDDYVVPVDELNLEIEPDHDIRS